MVQEQLDPSRHQHSHQQGFNRLLRRHPILTPLVLLTAAVLLGVASVLPTRVFPLLALFSIPPVPLFPLLALVLAVTGVLTAIIGALEYLKRAAHLDELKGA